MGEGQAHGHRTALNPLTLTPQLRTRGRAVPGHNPPHFVLVSCPPQMHWCPGGWGALGGGGGTEVKRGAHEGSGGAPNTSHGVRVRVSGTRDSGGGGGHGMRPNVWERGGRVCPGGCVAQGQASPRVRR